MTYQTILVHADKSPGAGRRYRMAAALAARLSAHLTGVSASGVSRFMERVRDEGGAPRAPGVLRDAIDALRRHAQESLRDFEDVARSAGIPVECELLDDEAEGGIGLRARYADLVVVGQTDLNDPYNSFFPNLPVAVALASGRPVLMVPRTGEFPCPPTKIMLAWDGSQSASRALAHAIPLMKLAEEVTVAVFNPEKTRLAREPASLSDLMAYLNRHGIRPRLQERHTALPVGEAMIESAAALKAELLVAGCYGHSRFHEFMAGGVTLTLLERATMPVLLAH